MKETGNIQQQQQQKPGEIVAGAPTKTNPSNRKEKKKLKKKQFIIQYYMCFFQIASVQYGTGYDVQRDTNISQYIYDVWYFFCREAELKRK